MLTKDALGDVEASMVLQGKSEVLVMIQKDTKKNFKVIPFNSGRKGREQNTQTIADRSMA